MNHPSDIAQYIKGRGDYRWSDDLPDILQQIIGRSLGDIDTAAVNVSSINWKDLGWIVSDYLDQLEYQQGFLNKTQKKQLNKIAKQASKLRDDIDQLRELGADWYLLSELNDAGIEESFLVDALKALSVASDLKPLSPKFEKDAEAKRSWLNDQARTILQVKLDAWWELYTGLSKNVPETQDTPYAEFLKELLSRVSRHNPPGYSESAVKSARRINSNRKKENKAREEEFAQALAKVIRRSADD